MYNKNYTNYRPNKYSNSYTPKKAVKNFKDLEVYQKALEGSVFAADEIINFLKASKRSRADIAKAEVDKSQNDGTEENGYAAKNGNVGSGDNGTGNRETENGYAANNGNVGSGDNGTGNRETENGYAANNGNVGSGTVDYEVLIEQSIIKNMVWCALSIPHLIAESHSKRFGTEDECLKILDEVMLKCNKMVVYLEQTRDILQTGIESERFNEEINKYFYIRRKVLNLQRVWRKYINQNAEDIKHKT